MKHKHAITATPPQPSSRPNRGRLYRVLAITGGLIAFVVLLAVGTVYWDPIMSVLWPTMGRQTAAMIEDEVDDKTPLKRNDPTPPGPATEGMVWIPGGEFRMGTEEVDYKGEPFADCLPVHRVYVDGFWMDKTEVTNEQFAVFVKATGYTTVAEKQPDPKDFPPDVPREKLKPFSAVFKKPAPGTPIDRGNLEEWWKLEYGASWQHPEGPSSNIRGREKHPVVHICYEDALAYCKWAGKRLPSEAEWEFAARGGLEQKKFTWGDDLKPNGKWQANAWQGNFPVENTCEDGYETTAPVGSFPPNNYGLYDMAGNVWEWCADWYRGDYYKHSPRKNPTGPDFSFDLGDHEQKRVQRGGSFLCSANYCERYIVGTRHPGEPKSAANHIGFRCVKDAR